MTKIISPNQDVTNYKTGSSPYIVQQCIYTGILKEIIKYNNNNNNNYFILITNHYILIYNKPK